VQPGQKKKLGNVALKVNMKLGGNNMVLSGGSVDAWCPALKK
jgi:hypothetical protein